VTLDYDSNEADSIRRKCNAKDVTTATTTLLGSYIKANADILVERPPCGKDGSAKLSITPDRLTFANVDKMKMRDLQGVKRSLTEKMKVKIPFVKEFNDEWEVMKVHLTGQYGEFPDPAAVAEKASIDCSHHFRQMLLPACRSRPVEETEDEDP